MAVQTDEVVYRTVAGRELKALIFRPDDAASSPAMVCMHGGAWISGDRHLPAYMARKLAARGFVVMSIDFRMAPQHMHPTSLRDANCAIRWLRKHAAEYGANAENVGGLGFSSGAHLILLSAMRPEHADYVAGVPADLQGHSAKLSWVISCSGVLDPLARYRMAKEADYADIIACHDKYFGTEACMREANPPLILARGETTELPPLLMFQGGADPRLPVDTAARMAELYRAAGGEATAVVCPGLGHALGEWPAEMQEQVADRMRAFVPRR